MNPTWRRPGGAGHRAEQGCDGPRVATGDRTRYTPSMSSIPTHAPEPERRPRERVGLSLSPEDLHRLDRARGRASRATWALHRVLNALDEAEAGQEGQEGRR